MPDCEHLVGYADDVAAMIVARNIEEAKRKVNQVIIRAKSWLEEVEVLTITQTRNVGNGVDYEEVYTVEIDRILSKSRM